MPSRPGCLLTAVWLTAALAGSAADSEEAGQTAPRMETIERVVAVVDEHPLLLSETRTLAAVRGLSEEAAVEAVVDEWLMHREASRMAQSDVSPEDERAALEQLYGREPRLHGRVPERELLRLLRRQIAILRYVELRFRPQVRVSDEEVRKAWAAEEAAGPALEDAEQALRARLERRKLDERIESWIRELRARADVRHVGRPPSDER